MIDQDINFENYAKDAPVFLGKHEYGRLREAIHTSQLGLFKEVFLRSLKVMNEVLRQVPVEGQNGISLFDQKINELCRAFKKLKDLPELYSNEAENFRNIAVTAFVFYRVVYSGAYSAFSKHHQTKVHFDVDPYILFKRIPYKLYDFLGGQYWRLYEFYEIVEGDLSKIKVNQDIVKFIEHGCNGVIFSLDKAVAGNDTADVLTVTQIEAVPIVPQNIELKPVNLECLKQEFIDWVQKQLDQNYLRLNEKGIFSLRFRYGTDLFIESTGLSEFANLYQKNLQDLKQALKASAGDKTYKVYFKKEVIEAYRLKGLKFIDDEFNPPEIKEEN